MQKKIKVGKVEIIHFYMPGKSLNDISLKKLHRGLVQIGEDSSAKNLIKLLDKNLTLAEIREELKNTVLALGIIDKVPYGFLVNPIDSDESIPTVKKDIFVLSCNPGENYNKMMALGNLIHLYDKIGSFISKGDFDLGIANVGKINWFKSMQIKLRYIILEKSLKKIEADRDVECETIKQIISYRL